MCRVAGVEILRLINTSNVHLLLIFAGFLSACSPAGTGPNRKQILSGAVENGGNAQIIYVNDHVTRATSFAVNHGFSNSFLSASELAPDTINAGDVLGFAIWENIDSGLLTATKASAADLTQIHVDSDGYIFVPYAGRVQAAGKTPDQLRQLITQRLSGSTPDPQVTVQRIVGDGATVSVMGRVNGQGVYPIEQPTRRLSSMLARAGGVAIEPEIAVVSVKRGRDSGRIWLKDLYAHPENNIALRAGDLVVVEEDVRSFTALGALSSQTRVPLGSEVINAIEAVAMVGGLNPQLSDPTGVFVLRDEPEEVASRVLGKPLSGSQRFVYVLDLTRPNGLFLARNFTIRDGDTVYVTDTGKQLQALGAVLNTASSLSSLVD
ncbi:MAG: polysaccharide biosynthesis/export family protein [Paracoccus sp. (in: a-proteobacteria)]